MTTPSIRGGVDRSHGSSSPQKATFLLLHIISLAICGFLVSGTTTIPGTNISPRAWLLLAVIVFAFARHAFTLYILIVRKITWQEGLPLGFFLILQEVGFLTLGMGILYEQVPPLGWLDGVGVALFLAGSGITTGSEFQRMVWKRNPEHKGKCYKEGLFRHSVHINYFGEVVSYSGWAILTATWWTGILPLFMLVMFVFYHIPHLDTHLRERYGKDFEEYEKRTKKLIPFVY
ncbi:MAG: DUF1295 domain-containing protein [Planctomycetota bacterium]|jgi:steroid 5-alpha reductase family enzyme|nr:DUF1295 domain-containing protein [Planctomycetota bacterium]|tara:strand:- start:111 stop:806 length:696 start_codon:yes stop_codon:yes gene_type:complete